MRNLLLNISALFQQSSGQQSSVCAARPLEAFPFILLGVMMCCAQVGQWLLRNFSVLHSSSAQVWLEKCRCTASALPHSHQHFLWELERLKQIIDTNHDQRRNDCHCKNVFINDLHIILWERYSARQNCDRFSPNGNISLQKCVALKGVKKLNVFPPVRKMTDQGQETIH